MNAMIDRLIHAPAPPVRLLFKGAFGLGMATVIMVGALFFLIGKNYTPALQLSAGIVGAMVGVGCAWWLGRQSSNH